jgi:NADP-dependent 3-hydroxy acid dehydrogenase YdfG
VSGFGRCLQFSLWPNNAGVFIAKPFTQYTVADYALVTAVNLTGFFHITQRVITQLVAQDDGGHVVRPR